MYQEVPKLSSVFSTRNQIWIGSLGADSRCSNTYYLMLYIVAGGSILIYLSKDCKKKLKNYLDLDAANKPLDSVKLMHVWLFLSGISGHPPPPGYQRYGDEDEDDDSPQYPPQHRPYEEEDGCCSCCGCHCSGFFKGW